MKKNSISLLCLVLAFLTFALMALGSESSTSKTDPTSLAESSGTKNSQEIEISTPNTITTEESPSKQNQELTVDEYLDQVNNAIAGAVGENEKITKINLIDRVLTVHVDFSDVKDSLPITLDELAISRASSITDNILKLDTSLWDITVIDFGEIGTVTRNKNDIVDSPYGKYFNITNLDNEDNTSVTTSETDSDANAEFVKIHENEIVVVAKMALDNFLSDYSISLAPQLWTIAKFDDTDTAIAMTDIVYMGQNMKYLYVGTLNINEAGKVVSAKPHYLEVNGVVLGDDGYCKDVFDIINSIGK